jgi:hypothetical protein
MLETVVTVSWGATLLVCMVGPFSAAPEITRVAARAPAASAPAPLPAPATAAAPAKTTDAGSMSRAA